MTAKELAEKLNGRKIGEEITEAESLIAKLRNLIVVFGASDDLAEFRGWINNEASCYDGGEILLTEFDLYEPECNDGCPHEQQLKDNCRSIKAVWDDHPEGFVWSYKLDFPHETFDIKDEDGSNYCRGVIFESSCLK